MSSNLPTDDALLITLTGIATALKRIERDLRQVKWLLLLVVLSVVGATVAILST